MKKKDAIFLILVGLFTAALCIFFAVSSRLGRVSADRNLRRQVFDGLEASLSSQSAFLQHDFEEKFASLETLSNFFGIRKQFDLHDEQQLVDAAILANGFRTIAYADLDGTVTTSGGTVPDSVREQAFFRKAADRKGQRTMEVVQHFPLADGGDCMIFAVPVRHENALNGILFALIDCSDYQQMLSSRRFDAQESIFILDAQGETVFGNETARQTYSEDGLLSSCMQAGVFRQESWQSLLNALAGSRGFGELRGEDTYTAYTALGTNDWVIFSVVPAETAELAYSADRRQLDRTMELLTYAFVSVVAMGILAGAYFLRKSLVIQRMLYKIQNKPEREDDVLLIPASPVEVNLETVAEVYRKLSEQSFGCGCLIRSTIRAGEPMGIYFVSPGLLRSLGYTKEEFTELFRLHLADIIHPDDLPAILELNRKYTSLGDQFQVEARYATRDGRYLWVQEYARILKAEDGSVVCASQFVDITQQKQLEEKLRVSEEEYRIATSMCDYVVLRYSIESRSIEVLSQGTCGLKFENALSDVPELAIRCGYIASESIETMRTIFAGINSGEEGSRYNVALQDDQGKKYWTEMSYSIIRDADGAPATAILTFTDVSEKQKAAELLSLGNTVLDDAMDAKLIVANLTSGLIEYESSGMHRNFTQMAASRDIHQVTQYLLRYVVTSESTVACREFASVKRLLEEYRNNRFTESFRCCIQSDNDTTRWMNVKMRMVKDPYSGEIKLYVVAKDLPQEAQMEQTPAQEQVLRTLSETEEAEEPSVFARTFGYFDLFVNGVPLHFTNPKEKELLAILIDRNGGTLSAAEGISILWEDEPAGEKQLTRYRKLASRLSCTLKEAGCEDIVITNHGVRHIDVTRLECDYYEALNGSEKYQNLFQGTYMLNYTWAEETVAALDRLLPQRAVMD